MVKTPANSWSIGRYTSYSGQVPQLSRAVRVPSNAARRYAMERQLTEWQS